ncbi:hypothetical protein [Streptomyces asiaticus]|uniref:hypothetical protein n=1 Tax=Streptomyces asiaticus TaxID=114695 RepID=UPI003D73CA77
MEAAQTDTDARVGAARRDLEECDRKLARHRAALAAGADPALVAGWSREVQGQRVTAEAKLARIENGRGRRHRMSRDEIRGLVDALGGLLSVLRQADPADKAEVYRQLGMHLTYDHETQTVLAETRPAPSMCVVKRVRGGLWTKYPTARALDDSAGAGVAAGSIFSLAGSRMNRAALHPGLGWGGVGAAKARTR